MPAKQTLEEIISKKPLNSGLTPIGFSEPREYKSGTRRMLLCKCVCGKECSVDVSYFISGKIISCGCLMILMARASRLTVQDINERVPQNSKLKVLKFNREFKTPSGNIKKEYLCQCECGNTALVTSDRIISGNTMSCGCLNSPEAIGKRFTKAYPVIKKLRRTYNNMMRRCYNPHHLSYRYYGAKGVTVCEEWKKDYASFLEWALRSGWDKDLMLDKDIRVPGNKVYGPETCLWVTPTQNSRYTSRNVKFNYNGVEYTIKQLEEITGIKVYKMLYIANKNQIEISEAIKLIQNEQNKNSSCSMELSTTI